MKKSARWVLDLPLTRLHQLDSIFAIFGSVSGVNSLYLQAWQIENRL
jgi:hypothetical protein